MIPNRKFEKNFDLIVKKMCISLFIALALFVSCDKNELSEPDEPPNDELLEWAYDKNYRYPVGFFLEQGLLGSTYYENSVSVNKQSPWVEFHTTNKNEARNWSNISNENSSVNRKIVQENETEKFFEFVRVNVVNENDVLLSRVHKSDYFIPYDGFRFFGSFETLVENKTIGTYYGMVTLDKVKEFIEYLWVRGIWNSDSKVIESKISEKNDKFEHHIQSLLIVYGDWGLHDKIYVFNNKFAIDKKAKVFTLVERKLVKEIEGNYNAGGGR